MRIALISDIHGNLHALEAVLADIARRRVDQVVCLGDVAASGPQPHEVVALLRQHTDSVVMGNTDAWLLDPQPPPADGIRRWEDIDAWCAERLTGCDLAWLRAFTPVIDLPMDDERLLAFHGSPRSFHDRIVATTSDGDLGDMLGDHDATVLAGGHTHVQLFRRLDGSIVLNPGSVGMPYQINPDGVVVNPAWAEYALVDAGGVDLSIDLRRVTIDRAAIAHAILTSGIPHADWLAEGWSL